MVSNGFASTDFLVAKKNFRKTEFVAGIDPGIELADGEILLKIDRFGFTANNVTYAATGDSLKYWQFFPSSSEEWGRIPVWGFGNVFRSNHTSLSEGDRIYGYLPMSTFTLLKPDRISPEGFFDTTPHRRNLPAAYNSYNLCSGDPAYDPAFESQQMLLRPLAITSFLLEDFLFDKNLFGAKSVLVSSASSKTALAFAFFLSQRKSKDCKIIGLTSAHNKESIRSLGYYDELISYEEVGSLPKTTSTIFVDMAGNGKLTREIHAYFQENLVYSVVVGVTHWEERSEEENLPGPKPSFFFAPARIRKRTVDWGRGGVETKFGESWKLFLPSISKWMNIKKASGKDEILSTYLEVLEGKSPPATGNIIIF